MRRHESLVHTVRLARSHAGFGFTITGQQPCVLSCIVRGSPAYEVGLRPGDFVVGVNGEDVTAALHDDVVRKIGNSGIDVTLQVLERRHRNRLGNSSSSSGELSIDENVSPNKLHHRCNEARPRRHNRRHRHRHRVADADLGPPDQSLSTFDVANNTSRSRDRGPQQSRGRNSRHKHEDPRTQGDGRRLIGSEFKKRSRPSSEVLDANRQRTTLTHVFPNALVAPALRPSGELRPDDTYEQPVGATIYHGHSSSGLDPILRALVGYCGSVEVPADGGSSNLLNIIRSALSRLRNEARVNVLVVIEVLSNSVRLVNHYGQMTADYASTRIAFFGGHPDDERSFGLVVSVTGGRYSCHMFRVLDADHCRHSVHGKEALAWGITCHFTSRGECHEFPSSPAPILACLATVFGNKKNLVHAASPPRPSQRASRPQSVPPHSVSGEREVKARSRSPDFRPGSVPPQRDPLEDKLCPRAIWTIPAPVKASGEPEFKVPPPPQADKDVGTSDAQPNFFRRFVKTGGSFRKKILGISQSHETLSISTTGSSKNEALSKQTSLSQTSIVGKENLQNSTISISQNTTLAYSEKSVYKSVSKEEEVDDQFSRVAKWATGFDCLLNDSAGLEIFTHFLKSEYSEENIEFWLIVEKFKRADEENRRALATEIFSKHLAAQATEPVNVDAAAKETVHAALKSPDAVVPTTMFDVAQKQIYNLMRLDSYARFIKSELYKNCVVCELDGRPLPGGLDTSSHCTPERSHALKTAKSSTSLGYPDSEEKKRRPFFPWIRRSKRFGRANGGVSGASKSPGRSKKEESESANKGHCRVNFPDGTFATIDPATMDASTTVRQYLQGVCAKHGIALHASEILCAASPDKLVDLSMSAASLQGKTLNIEERVVFRLEIPSRHKTLGIRTKPNKSLKDVLRLVCERYDMRMDEYICSLEGAQRSSLSIDTGVKEIDHRTMNLKPKSDMNDVGTRPRTPGPSSGTSVNEWLSAPWVTFDFSGVYDPQVPVAVGHNATVREKKSERKSALRKSASTVSTSKLLSPSANDTDDERFLELLTRMTNQRLDDQRGQLSKAPLELPEFLKPKDQAVSHQSRARAFVPSTKPSSHHPVVTRAHVAPRQYIHVNQSATTGHRQLSSPNPHKPSNTSRHLPPNPNLSANRSPRQLDHSGYPQPTHSGHFQPAHSAHPNLSHTNRHLPISPGHYQQTNPTPHQPSSAGHYQQTNPTPHQPSSAGHYQQTNPTPHQPSSAGHYQQTNPTPHQQSSSNPQPNHSSRHQAIFTSQYQPPFPSPQRRTVYVNRHQPSASGTDQSHRLTPQPKPSNVSPNNQQYWPSTTPVRKSSNSNQLQPSTSPGTNSVRSHPVSPNPTLTSSHSPDMPYMDASSIMTSTPRSKSSFYIRDSSPVFLRDAQRGGGDIAAPIGDLTTPPPLPFRDSSGSVFTPTERSSRSTPSPTTHLLLPPDSPQHQSNQPSAPIFLATNDERATFV